MEAVSQVWGGDQPQGTNGYENLYTWLSNEYNYMTYTATNDNNMHSGWDFVISINASVPIFGYGKYKFIVDLGNTDKLQNGFWSKIFRYN
jgi:hypothetical protein